MTGIYKNLQVNGEQHQLHWLYQDIMGDYKINYDKGTCQVSIQCSLKVKQNNKYNIP